MAEKEGETKYANINKEEGGREGYEEEEKKDSQGVEEGGEDRGWRSGRGPSLDTFLHMIEPMKSRGRLTRFGHCGNLVAVS